MVEVVISYSYSGVKGIEIDRSVELDITAIKGKSISEWFVPSSGRDGWKGLIEEIRDIYADDEMEISWEFWGPEENKKLFFEELEKYGYKMTDDNKNEDKQEILEEKIEKVERKIPKMSILGKTILGKREKEKEVVAEEKKIENKVQPDVIEVDFTEAEKREHRGQYKMAFEEYYRIAQKQNSSKAQYKIGTYYMEGLGVEKDENKAVEWYQKAAEQGNAEAQCELGICYEDGCGVKEDAEKAVEWYQKSAEQGYAEAQYELGLCYEVNAP